MSKTLTIAAEIEDIVECSDHFAPDFRTQCSSISSQVRAYSRNMIGIVKNCVAKCVLDLKFLFV